MILKIVPGRDYFMQQLLYKTLKTGKLEILLQNKLFRAA